MLTTRLILEVLIEVAVTKRGMQASTTRDNLSLGGTHTSKGAGIILSRGAGMLISRGLGIKICKQTGTGTTISQIKTIGKKAIGKEEVHLQLVAQKV